jgi:hypothetical protein
MTPEVFWKWAGGRRFAITLGSGVVNTALVYLGKIDQATFKELILATVGVYIAANTVQKWKEAHVNAASN